MSPLADETYNGWRNRATWCVALWLSEMDYGAYVRDRYEDWSEDGMTGKEVLDEVTDDIESMVDGMYDECVTAVEATTYGLFASDLLLNRPDWINIDYRAIAKEYVDDYEGFRSESIRSAYNKAKVRSKAKEKPAAKTASASKRKVPAKKPQKKTGVRR